MTTTALEFIAAQAHQDEVRERKRAHFLASELRNNARYSRWVSSARSMPVPGTTPDKRERLAIVSTPAAMEAYDVSETEAFYVRIRVAMLSEQEIEHNKGEDVPTLEVYFLNRDNKLTHQVALSFEKAPAQLRLAVEHELYRMMLESFGVALPE